MRDIKIAAIVSAALLFTAPMVQASPFEFGGFYAGGQFGYQESSADFESISFGRGGREDPPEFEQNLPTLFAITQDLVFLGGNGGNKLSDSGLTGGLFAGYNFMRGNVMFGVETDISLTGANPSGACPNQPSASCEVDVGPMATLRPRVGFGIDDFLIYATGGAAAARFDVRTQDSNSHVSNQGAFGWTVGAGVEYLVGDMIGVRLEYRYLRFGDFDTIEAHSNANIKVDMHTILGGVAWHF